MALLTQSPTGRVGVALWIYTMFTLGASASDSVEGAAYRIHVTLVEAVRFVVTGF